MKSLREEATGRPSIDDYCRVMKERCEPYAHAIVDGGHYDEFVSAIRDGYLHLVFGMEPPPGSPAARDLETLYCKQEPRDE